MATFANRRLPTEAASNTDKWLLHGEFFNAWPGRLNTLIYQVLQFRRESSRHRNLRPRRRMYTLKIKTDDYPWKVHNGVATSWQTRSFDSKNNIFDIIKWVSLFLSADGNTTIFGPIRPSCMHKCILHLFLRFLCARPCQSFAVLMLILDSLVQASSISMAASGPAAEFQPYN
jgi:hypothetical protein